MLLDVDEVDNMLSTKPMSHLALLADRIEFNTYVLSVIKNLWSFMKIFPDFRTV
jgi:hypothetical protein